MSKYSLSPNKSTIGLSSQQKDLLIIHLKGEVYELKQADLDYKSLLEQVQTMQQRLKFLTDEKEFS